MSDHAGGTDAAASARLKLTGALAAASAAAATATITITAQGTVQGAGQAATQFGQLLDQTPLAVQVLFIDWFTQRLNDFLQSPDTDAIATLTGAWMLLVVLQRYRRR